MNSRPFRQGRFEALPAAPRRPHSFFEQKARTLRMVSAPFGPIDINYYVVGEGEPLLLIHGLMTTSYSWRYVLELLGKHFTLYIPDLPGCGRSGKPQAASYHPGKVARWIREFQEETGIVGCRCIGNSMGGYLTMLTALQFPDSFSHLINLHSPGMPEPRLYALQAVGRIPVLRIAARKLIHRDPLRWAHKNVHYNDESLKSLQEAKEYGEPLSTREGADAFIDYLLETLNPADMRAFVKTLKAQRASGAGFPCPLTLIYAEQDPLVKPAIGPKLHKLIPDASLAWLENTSHFAHVDTPEQFAQSVMDSFATSISGNRELPVEQSASLPTSSDPLQDKEIS